MSSSDENVLILNCAVCGNEIQRSVVLRGNPWVHCDETVSLRGSLFSRALGVDMTGNNYDHEAQPDNIIDIESREVHEIGESEAHD